MKLCLKAAAVTHQDSYFTVQTDSVPIRIWFLTDQILRIRAGFDGDFSEEYQALYHEKVWDAICRRDFIAGSFVAELYDADVFSSGLICADGVTKKDAYWFYKSQWSDDKFVKIAGERYRNRVDKKVTVKIYSNCRAVTLYVNGKAVKNPAGVNSSGVFLFREVRLIRGDNTLRAETEDGCVDEIVLHRGKNEDTSYVFAAAQTE